MSTVLIAAGSIGKPYVVAHVDELQWKTLAGSRSMDKPAIHRHEDVWDKQHRLTLCGQWRQAADSQDVCIICLEFMFLSKESKLVCFLIELFKGRSCQSESHGS